MSEPERWLQFAWEDLQVAELTLQAGLLNQVCFHSHQCVEKAIKGLLIHQGVVPPRTHKLVDLMSVLVLNPLEAIEAEIQLLDRFYILTRYPDIFPSSLSQGLPDTQDATQALNLARQTLKQVQQAILTQSGR